MNTNDELGDFWNETMSEKEVREKIEASNLDAFWQEYGMPIDDVEPAPTEMQPVEPEDMVELLKTQEPIDLETRALLHLSGRKCWACGYKKKQGQSFCYSCFNKLPPKMRHDLYNGINEGYPEIYDAALRKLHETINPNFWLGEVLKKGGK